MLVQLLDFFSYLLLFLYLEKKEIASHFHLFTRENLFYKSYYPWESLTFLIPLFWEEKHFEELHQLSSLIYAAS